MPSSGMWRYGATCSQWFITRGFFYPEHGGDTFFRNVGSHKIYTAAHPRRRHSSRLKWRCEAVDWLQVAPERIQWRARVNAVVVNLEVP
jgi:hypothetical protein